MSKNQLLPRYPMPPYTTSLLQQDAYYKNGFSSKQTMRLAQDLYERGLITYHRTDSFNLSARFVFPAKEYIEKNMERNMHWRALEVFEPDQGRLRKLMRQFVQQNYLK